jgi:hypothetical protein
MKYIVISNIKACIHDVESMQCIDTLHNVNGLLGLNKKCTNYLCGVIHAQKLFIVIHVNVYESDLHNLHVNVNSYMKVSLSVMNMTMKV